jgi:hypothetical protein
MYYVTELAYSEIGGKGSKWIDTGPEISCLIIFIDDYEISKGSNMFYFLPNIVL